MKKVILSLFAASLFTLATQDAQAKPLTKQL